MVNLESIKSILVKPALAAVLGGTITFIGHAWRPFVYTSPFHGAAFSFTVALVANIATPFFSNQGCNPKIAVASGFADGVITALSLSVGMAYADLTTSAVSTLGVFILSLSAASSQYIIR